MAMTPEQEFAGLIGAATMPFEHLEYPRFTHCRDVRLDDYGCGLLGRGIRLR